jgi:glucose/mannose-6-phosphate isomerase
VVNRSYTLPEFVNKSTLVVVSSYSGNTEETLSAYKTAREKNAKILCLTTGGEVMRLAEQHRNPVIKVVPGLQPRAALGYSFFPLLLALTRIGLLKDRNNNIRETVDVLWKLSRQLGNYRNKTNRAIRIARALHGRLPIIYSSSEHLDAVNVRWRGQISENAKQLAYGHVLPEMNHNEIVGWDVDRALLKKSVVLFLKDKGVHDRVRLREEITRSIVRRHAGKVLEVSSEGSSLLARIFSLVYLGDWVSYYLAILNRRNPTPVKVIEYLKGELAKS